MIKHEEARGIIHEILFPLDTMLDLFEHFINPTIFQGLKSDIKAIDFKLTQQEKKDELLGLYRECNEEGYFWLEIQQRIKALEEEMK